DTRRGGDSAWNGKHFAPEIGRETGGDQGAAPLGCLDHADAEAEAGERAVAGREVTGECRHVTRELRHERSLSFDRAREPAVLRRVHDVDTAAEDGERAAARAERAT